MEDNPSDPLVQEAYKDLIDQTRSQYEALVEDGYQFTFFDATTDPYDGNPYNAIRDLRNNKRMAVYGTYDGFNGYIKKMKPGLNGRYQTSNKAAQFKLIQKDGLWEMHFEGDQKSTLSLLELDSLEYAVKDQGQVRYYYKRYEPININDE